MVLRNKYILILLIILIPGIVHARCQINEFEIHLFPKDNLSGKKIYAEVEDKLGENKVELKYTKDGTYYGRLSFATSGMIIFIELNCSYFPKHLTIYIDNDVAKKVRLNKDDLKSYWNEDKTRLIYNVDVHLEN